MDGLNDSAVSELKIAGFFRRIGAFVLDSLLIGVFGALMGAAMFDTFAQMGNFAKLVGFLIALAYFGSGNSRLFHGRTLGKYCFDICVIGSDGNYLTVLRSMLRYAILGIPLFLNGLFMESSLTAAQYIQFSFSALIVACSIAIPYFYLFNRRTRQSLHDLIVGSYVVREESETQVPNFPTAWRGHIYVAVLLSVLVVGGLYAFVLRMQAPLFSQLFATYEVVSSRAHVKGLQLSHVWHHQNEKNSRSLHAVLRLDAPLIDDEALARSVAQELARLDEKPEAHNAIAVTLVYGYDMGIASWWKKRSYVFSKN